MGSGDFRPSLMLRLMQKIDRIRDGIGAFFGATSEKLHKNTVQRATEAFEDTRFKIFNSEKGRALSQAVEERTSRIQNILHMMFWVPFTWIYNSFGSFFSWIYSTLARVLFPMWLKVRVSEISESADEKITKAAEARDRVVGKHFSIISNSVGCYLGSRKFSRLLGAIPSVVMLLPVCFFAARIPTYSDQRKAGFYHIEAIKARDQGDFKTASLCYRKIRTLLSDSDIYIYESAVSAAEAGNIDEAYELMNQIAALEEEIPSFAAAHIWIAGSLLRGKIDVKNATEIARQHLKKSLIVSPGNAAAIITLAELYIRQEKYAEAIDLIRPLEGKQTVATLFRARIHLAQGEVQQATEKAAMVDAAYRKKSAVRKLPLGDIVFWSQAAELLDQPAEVQRIMEMLESDASTDSDSRDALVRFYCARFDQLIYSDDTFAATQLELMQKAAKLDPTHEGVVERVAILTKKNNDIGNRAREIIEQVERSQTLSNRIETTLAVSAFQRKDYDDAVERFEKLYAANSSSAKIANNLAWLLTQTTNPNLERALQMANRANELNHGRNALHRETRGQILVRLGRYDEAIVDLEFAINGIPESRELMDSLATAYERTGKMDQANLYRERAALLDE